MWTPRLVNCDSCGKIPNLLAAIDCKIALEARKMYENITLLLNNKIDECLIKDLLQYKRILTFKYYNTDYAKDIPLSTIINRVRILTAGLSNCNSVVSLAPITEVSPTTVDTTTTLNPN